MQDFIFKDVEDGTLAVVGYKGDEPDVVIPVPKGKNITILGDNLFSGHKEIRSIAIPDTVTDMGEFLFDGCEELKSLKLPKELTTLWGYTFARCGLEEITLPDKLKAIPPFAFKDCRNLKRVVPGKELRKIHAWAFGGWDQLQELLCGGEVEISPQAFLSKELNR